MPALPKRRSSLEARSPPRRSSSEEPPDAVADCEPPLESLRETCSTQPGARFRPTTEAWYS